MRKAYLFALVRKFLTLPLSSAPSLPQHSQSNTSTSHSGSSTAPSAVGGLGRYRLRFALPAKTPSLSLAAFLQRLPIISHSLLLLLIVFGPYYAPLTLSIMFFITHMGFFLSQIRSLYGMFRCWYGVRQHSRTDWVQYYRTQCLALESKLSLPPTPTSPYAPLLSDRILPLLAVEHIIILPNYKETLGTLRETLDVLASHPLAARTYKVCLAMEERETGSGEKAALLADEYARAFADIAYTLHPGTIPGESAGKSSNVAWASRFMASRELDAGSPARLARQVITVMDADTCFAADFFLAVGVKFALAPPELRERMMFAPPIVFDRNLGEVPVFTRVVDILWSSAGIGGLYPGSTVKIPTSAYAISMSLAIYVNFWDAGPEAIGEDMHMFCKAMFDTCGHLYVETIYSPASQCNVVGAPARGVQRLANDAGARWTQAIRHMWGSLDTGYAWGRLLTSDFGPSTRPHLLSLGGRSVSASPSPRLRAASRARAASDSEPPSSPSALEPAFSDSESDFPLTGTVSPATTLVGEDLALLPTGSNSADALLAASSLLGAPVLKPLGAPSAWKSAPLRWWPVLVLMTRLYEAHLMVAHFFFVVTLMNVFPSVVYANGAFRLLDLANAPAFSLALLRTPYAGTAPPPAAASAWDWLALSPAPAGAAVVWVLPDLVAAVFAICKILSTLGIIFSIGMAFMHDVYHREAASVRWRNSAAALQAHRARGSAEKAHDDGLSFCARYLGIRPRQTATRRLPFSWLDFLAIPAGLAYGVAPLLVAQFRHLWTNKLMYTVSAKPVNAVLEREVVLGVMKAEVDERGREVEEKMEMSVLEVVRETQPVQVDVGVA